MWKVALFAGAILVAVGLGAGVTLLAANRVSPMGESLPSPDPSVIVRCNSVYGHGDACRQGDLDVRRPIGGRSCPRSDGPGIWRPVNPTSVDLVCRPVSKPVTKRVAKG